MSCCTEQCGYVPGTKICGGCGRTDQDLINWSTADIDEKKIIILAAKERKKNLSSYSIPDIVRL